MSDIKNVREYGNNLVVLLDDNTQVLCYPTQGGFWIPAGNGGVVPGTDFKWPFPRSTWNFTSYYGHSGIDRSGGSGDDVKAIGPGTVKEVYHHDGNTYGVPGGDLEPVWRGNCVVINHGTIGGRNISSLYAHMLSEPLVDVGDPIIGGQIIGKVGNSGYSTGAHLHLEVIYNNQRLSSSAPNQTSVGRGFTRTLNWMDDNTDGSNW